MTKSAGSRRRRSGTNTASLNPLRKRIEQKRESLGKKKDKTGTKTPESEPEIEVEATVDDSSEKKKKKKQKPHNISKLKTSGVVGKIQLNAEGEEAVATFVQKTLALGVEGIRKEFAELKAYVPVNYDHSAFDANEARNRYKDIVCLDATRVPLTLNVPPETDYIHANWVKMENVDKTSFIATQGPLENTIPDFWRLVHQEGVSTILMVCMTEENGKPKCAQYWPLDQGSYQTYGCMFVNNKKVDKEDKCTVYTLEVLPEGCSNSTITKLVQITDWWPDRCVPQSGMGVLRILKCIVTGGPCIVHCSAGVGRTGTVIAVETVIQRLFKGQQVNVKDVVMQLRNLRANAVQTEGQFVFIHICVLYYISAKMKKYVETVLPFHNDYKAAGMS